jgi:hypothetical protein
LAPLRGAGYGIHWPDVDGDLACRFSLQGGSLAPIVVLVDTRFYLDPATGMKRNRFPAGWNEARVRRVLEHYERQTEDEAIVEDEAAFQLRGQTVMVVPRRLVPEIRRLIEGRRSGRRSGLVRPNKALQPAAHRARRG